MSCLHNAYRPPWVVMVGYRTTLLYHEKWPFSLLNVCSELCSLCSYNLLQQSVVFVVYILPCKSSCTSNIFTKATYEDHKPSKIRYKPWLVFLRPRPPKLHHAPLVHIQYNWQHMFIKLTGHLPRLQIMVSVSPNSCIDLQL